MKKIIQITSLFVIITSCTKDNGPIFTQLDKPNAVNIYCQTNPDEYYQRIEYQYNNDNLISETTFSNGKIYSIRTFEYNTNNKLSKEICDLILNKYEKLFIYNELNQLISIKNTFIYFDSNGQIETKYESDATFEYENNLLVREVEYWGGSNTYEYDDVDNIITKTEYTKNGEKHHITHYTYSGSLKTKEWKETYVGTTMYFRTYLYNSIGRLTKVLENDKIIVENSYDDNRLLEKKEYYFGIDPGFDFCYGNYIYKYEY